MTLLKYAKQNNITENITIHKDHSLLTFRNIISE